MATQNPLVYPDYIKYTLRDTTNSGKSNEKSFKMINTMTEIKKIIHEKDVCRLDKALCQHFPQFSRTFLSKLIDEKLVKINNKIIEKSAFLVFPGNLIEVQILDLAKESFAEQQEFKDIEIISETNEFILINKPAGLLTHPVATAKNAPSVVSVLEKKMAFDKNFTDPNRGGIVHRLDRDTSGLLIIAKNVSASYRFSEIFKQRRIKKKYLAIICGTPKWQTLSISKPIGRDPRNPTKMKTFGLAAKEAKTFVKIISRGEKHSLLEVEIATGRTHQIRVHLADIGFPILGDHIYGQSNSNTQFQALHAFSLEFQLGSKKYSFQAKPPQTFLSSLKNTGLEEKFC